MNLVGEVGSNSLSLVGVSSRVCLLKIVVDFIVETIFSLIFNKKPKVFSTNPIHKLISII